MIALRRGFVLVAVLIIVGAAMLVATSVLFMVTADVGSSVHAAREVQSRALAWSGTQIVMNRLDRQRDAILEGTLPEVDDEYVVFEEDGRLGLVRLLSLGPMGESLVPEASKLDVNRVDAEMLEATGFITPTVARAIVGHRDENGRFASMAELLDVRGVDAELLFGPIEDISIAEDVDERERGFAEGPRGLADLLTVYAHEPALQRNGTLRINLNVPWSSELGERIDERFGDGASQMLQQIMNDQSFDSDEVIYETLNSTGSPTEQWPDIVDALTTRDDGMHFGRVDLNTASYEALMALPGLEATQAAEIVSLRDSLSADDLATVAWPAVHGVVEPAQYEQLAPWLTTRSWTYRLRLAAGVVDADEPDGPIPHAVVFEVVVDLSPPTARMAYVRDVTMLETAARLAMAGQATDGDDDDDAIDDEDPRDDEYAESDPATDDALATMDDVATLDDLGFDLGPDDDAPEDGEGDDVEPEDAMMTDEEAGDPSDEGPPTSSPDDERGRDPEEEAPTTGPDSTGSSTGGAGIESPIGRWRPM